MIQNIGIDLSPDDVLPPGTALPISVDNFLTGKLDKCPLKFLKPAAREFCLGLTGPGGIKNFFKSLLKTQVSQELLNLRLLQSITAAQSAGNTLVLGMPAGFVPIKRNAAYVRLEG